MVVCHDGSTDDSGAELDRFAKKYPDTVKVIHQANSGGPAAPSNRALDVATGRYVYFIGSDDHLAQRGVGADGGPRQRRLGCRRTRRPQQIF